MNYFEILSLLITSIAGTALMAAIGTNLHIKVTYKSVEVRWAKKMG